MPSQAAAAKDLNFALHEIEVTTRGWENSTDPLARGHWVQRAMCSLISWDSALSARLTAYVVE